MDSVYLWVGKIVAWGGGGLALWLLFGFVMFLIYHARWTRHNGCWVCQHGDVVDPVAQWFARRMYLGSGLFLVMLAAPILVPIGVVTFYRVQLAFERSHAGYERMQAAR